MRRRAAAVLACAALLLSRGVAYADDPEPPDWPTIEAPAGGGSTDPQPIDWPAPEPL
jgi:hypothetical protein